MQLENTNVPFGRPLPRMTVSSDPSFQPASVSQNDNLVLIHTPFGRDGALIQSVLARAGLSSQVCDTMPSFEAAIAIGAGAAIVGEEALTPPVVAGLEATLQNQPEWSDLPIFVMMSGNPLLARQNQPRLRHPEPLGNVTLLERPLSPIPFISGIRGALRARQHQYQIRDHMAQRQIDSAALRQTNEELRQANSELQQFVYSASHDLQEPLRMVSIYSQLLGQEYAASLQGDAGQYLAYTIDGARRMEQLLKDLLLYSQSTAVREPPPSPVDTNRALDYALANLRANIDQSGAIVARDSLPALFVHELHLHQLFQNLIGNAVKYGGSNRPRIAVRATRQTDAWLFSVADNGIGIDPKHSDLIFGIFKRLHRTCEYSGTGIGLAICKKIVELYRGRIWVESEPGQGATFFFTVPDRQPALTI
jgi:signal transduction histidine kinase